MSRYRCNGCGGIYQSQQADGMEYFHVCPPLTDHDTGTELERPGHRDENPDPTARLVEVKEGVIQRAYVPRAKGAGRTKLPNA